MNNNDKFWELVTAKIHNQATKNELAELDMLLENKQNKTDYRKIERLKTDLNKVEILSHVSRSHSWKKISNELRDKKIQLCYSILKYAAIVIFAFFLGSLFTNQFNNQDKFSGYAEVRVPLGQMSEMTLSDGTEVWLNSGTTLRYNTDFGKKERNVSLKGEAFFDVSKTGTPFIVKFKNREVKVLGTRFNVIAYDDENSSQVTLVEGQVIVNNKLGKRITELKPSEQITIDELSNKSIITKVNTDFYMSWIDGKMVFNEEKLSTISKKLERWYNVKIKFEKGIIGDLNFSGTILKNKPLDQIVSVFEILMPIKIKYTHVPEGKDIVLISKK